MFSTKINESIAEADIVFISVNTPTRPPASAPGARVKNCELCENDRSVDVRQDRRREVHRSCENL